MINEAVSLVKNFHYGAGQHVANMPEMMTTVQVRRRVQWIRDELLELEEAKTIEEQADAVTDCLYYLLGCYVEMGIEPDPLFKIVHEANMSKLVNLRKDADGRVLKPDGWSHPDIEIKKAIYEEK